MSAINYWDGTKWVTLNTTGATGAQGPKGDKGDAGADGVDGKGLNPTGDWQADTDYALNDLVQYGGSSYVLVDVPPTGTKPDDPGAGAYWNLVASKGADGATGADGQGFTYEGEFTAGTDYDRYDVVTFNGTSYVQVAPPNDSNSTPDLDPDAWKVLASGGADGPEGPRGPNCYVQVAEPVGGGVGELWIDPDAVAAGAEPCLPLAGGTMTGNVIFDTTRQTAGDNKEIVCRGGGVAAAKSSYWGLEFNPDDNAGITYCVGAYIGPKASNEAAGLAGYGFLSDLNGPSSYGFWARGNAPSRFAGNVSIAADLILTGAVTAPRGAISGEAVTFPNLYSTTDADYALQYDIASAGRRDRRLVFSSATGHKITIPANSTAAFPLGWEVVIYNLTIEATGANRCEIVAAAGVQVSWGEAGASHNTGVGDRLRVRNNNGLVRLVKVNTNTWQAFGDTVKV